MTDLTIRRLAKAYGRVRVLDGVDLHVPAGSLTVILGPSGCGKTTLLRLIAGFDRPDAGAISLGGRPLCEGGRAVPPERRRIGYVAQEGALFPHLTVAGNIEFGLSRAERRGGTRVADMLNLVGLTSAYARRYPHELSGGQQQRVALARALAPRPGVVLLDEPFSSLDAALRDGTRRAVSRALAAAGATAVLVTHDQPEALSLADQVAIMRDGRLVQAGPPAEVYRAPADLAVAAFLGDAVVLPATARGGGVACELGTLPLRRPVRDGAARALIRPEQIAVGPPAALGVVACVLQVTYYGQDAAVQLRLDGSGTVVTARVPGHAAPPRDAQVCLRVEGEVMAYPA